MLCILLLNIWYLKRVILKRTLFSSYFDFCFNWHWFRMWQVCIRWIRDVKICTARGRWWGGGVGWVNTRTWSKSAKFELIRCWLLLCFSCSTFVRILCYIRWVPPWLSPLDMTYSWFTRSQVGPDLYYFSSLHREFLAKESQTYLKVNLSNRRQPCKNLNVMYSRTSP